MTSRFARAKDQVIRDLDSLVPELFGRSNVHERHNGFGVANPWRPKSHTGQMIIWRQGSRRGAFKDYAGTEKGDAIDLIAFAKTGSVTDDSRLLAVEWLEERYGLRALTPARKQQLDDEAVRRREAGELEAIENARQGADRARKSFFACDPVILGSLVETYLATRAVRLSEVPNLSPSIRFRPDCEYWMVPGRPKFPGMVTAMVNGAGRLGAVHYTLLEPDGRSKLDTRARGYLDERGRPYSSKLMYPSTAGLVMRLTYGPSGLNAEKAAEAGLLDWFGVTEGLEDGLSAAIAFRDLRMHAAGSLSGFLEVPDHAAAKGYLLFRDNDWHNPQAIEQFERAEKHFRSFGKPVEAIAMPASWGKDVNEAINQGA